MHPLSSSSNYENESTSDINKANRVKDKAKLTVLFHQLLNVIRQNA